VTPITPKTGSLFHAETHHGTKTAADPVFAAIEAHRQATAARYTILEMMGGTRDDAPERRALEVAHDEAAEVEVAATVKLRKTLPTTIAGLMAVTTYFVEHMDRYPGWIGGEIAYDDPCWFGDGLMRSLAAALAKINRTPRL
jgi:hypothetical protein